MSEFGGVFNTTSIGSVKISHHPCYIVTNLSPQGSPGTHWVGILLCKGAPFYFDSFGRKCKSQKIKKYLQSLGYKSYNYSKKQVQHIFSTHCGYFVMSYFILLNKGWKTTEILSLFKDQEISNDKLAKKIVDDYILCTQKKLKKIKKNI